MPATSDSLDPRTQFTAVLDQVERQIEALTPDDLGRPTPCAEYDVRTLLAHLVAVMRKLIRANHGGDTTQVPDPADDLSGEESEAFGKTRAELESVWAPGSELAKSCTMPWGTLSGRELLDAYTHEFTVHSWDLSRATGRDDRLDPTLAQIALDWYAENVPAEGRGEGGPFAQPVAVPADADPYTRLAGYVGRQV